MNEALRKTQIREAVRGKRRFLSPGTVSASGKALTEQFLSVTDKDLKALISSCECVALYKAVNGELPCDGIADFFLSHGRTVCYPKVKGDMIEFYEVNNTAIDFTAGAYNIPEPRTGSRHVPDSEIDLMIVPGVAFSKEGIRLGQGGGFYDRWFDRAERSGKLPFTIGVCYDFQMYSTLPVQRHDRSVDCVMSVRSGEA
ncbi:MAG: 5-formyltetrahydrofolate cyclo-ligase [Clostridiales bacterium]|nr:5-formyltetrahydrofolate cyclo-ligase [Clostridiales bacterium]